MGDDERMSRHDEVALALRSREPIFHRLPRGASRAAIEAMTAEEFWEVGASGNVYSRERVVGEVVERYAEPDYDPMAGLALDDDTFDVRELGHGIWLVTYRLRQGEHGERLTRRASLWRETADGWLLVYHQGTVVSPSPD